MNFRASFLLACLVACSSDESAATPVDVPPKAKADECRSFDLRNEDGTCLTIGFAPCPAGFVADASGMGCVDALPTCGGSELPVLGGGCTAVGATSCPNGFVKDESALGCKPASPTTTCNNALREDFATSCVPIGDCNAPFPPPGATIFVDDNGPVDATHFQTIAAAIAAAPSGATIAIDAGNYPAPVNVTKPLSLVGRCAAQVSIDGSAGIAAGLRASGVANVHVRGVRIAGFEPGISVEAGGSLDVEESLVEANRGYGARVTGAGSHLGLARSTVRSTVGPGVRAEGGADLVMDSTGVAGNREYGVSAVGAATKAKLRRVRIVSTAATPSTMTGFGIVLESGADVEVDESAIESNQFDGVVASGATLRLGSSSVVGAGGSSVSAKGAASVSIAQSLLTGAIGAELEGFGGSSVSVVDSALVGGNGGVNARGSKVTLERIGIQGVRGFAIGAREAATIDATSLLVRGTRDNAGIAYAVIATSRGTVTGRDVAIIDTKGAGIVAFDKGSKATLEHAIISDLALTSAGLGFGALAEAGGELTLRHALVKNASSLGVISRGGAVTLDDALVRDVKGEQDGLSGVGLLLVGDGTATATRAGFTGCALAGILAGNGSTLVASNVTVSGTRVDTTVSFGRGVSVQDRAIVDLTRSILVDNVQLELAALGNCTARVSDSLLGATRQVGEGEFGHGAFSEQARLDLHHVVVRDQPGIAVAYSMGTGRISRSTIEQNAVGIHVQRDSNLVVGDAEPNEHEVMVSEDTVFSDNQSRVGSGEVVFPVAVKVPK